MTKKLLLIDSSYYNFYRFFATKSWYIRNPDRLEEGKDLDWIDNTVFMTTYEKMWFETMKKLQKMFTPDHLIFARDGNDVWRYKIYPEYKANREGNGPCEEGLNIGPGPVFKHTNTNYHSKIDKSSVVRVNEAEADDIIAIAVKYYLDTIPGCEITVITGDHDLLQLSAPQVQIYNLKGKKFTNITSDDPYGSKMMKVLSGDPSDNIKGSFPRCGKVTAAKLIKDSNLLQQWANKHGCEQFNLNCALIDFAYIPVSVKDDIKGELYKVSI